MSVTGLGANSGALADGEVFFALPGTRTHGAEYIDEAVDRGARAIVCDRPADAKSVPVIVIEEVRAAFAVAAANRYRPMPETIVGVTGTSGKTSVVSFLTQIWARAGVRGASIGTLGTLDTLADGHHSGGDLTTPDALELHRSLFELKGENIDRVALEASSHGIDQHRLDGVGFSAVGFTNLSHDHLDYHGDMESYRSAKLGLFNRLLRPDGFAVVNCDDPEHMPFMFAALERGATLMTVGREGAHIEILSIERDGGGQNVVGRRVGEDMAFRLPLVGEFQVSNAIVAAALAMASGVESEAAIEALNHLKGPKGRLELVGEHNGASIFIDYSHKPAALKSVLETLRPLTSGRLGVVFGAGGDRDRGKRALMGKIANEHADFVVVTDDNPRTENAGAIRADILKAVPDAREIGDRAEAIATAVAGLQAGDILLVAGKGHEEHQIVGTRKLSFSDHGAVAEAIGA
ncbi:MAG: UDP-N-acetylmuramoyl-L-alanyl-D-glutamate--2,6-diaminopimelate ligase [Alphaproteobacteria bacterium]|nr:UDP-N-acetylmuramoyl-L-alanyl-D-glutamate--2,6-diaminopimelate ligase [Alphaproteobacteria bacterium]